MRRSLWLWLPVLVLLAAHLGLSIRAEKPTELVRADPAAGSDSGATVQAPSDTSDSVGEATAGQTPPAQGTAPGCVNVNAAGAERLTGLHGIGPVLAQRIVAYREEHGPYPDAESLLKVKGIGPAKLAGIRDHICF